MGALSATKHIAAVAGEWLSALLYVGQNPIVRLHYAASRRQNHIGQRPTTWLIIAWVAFAVFVAPELWQWYEFLVHGKALVSLRPTPFMYGPGLRLFRLALAGIYVPWLSYATYRSTMDAYNALADGRQGKGRCLPDELRLSSLSHASFVLAVLRIALPRLWYISLGGSLVFSLIAWSLTTSHPWFTASLGGHSTSPHLPLTAALVCLAGVLASVCLTLAFMALGRGVRSGLSRPFVGFFAVVAQLTWLWVLHSDPYLEWLGPVGWESWHETTSAEQLTDSALFIGCLLAWTWPLLRWAAVNLNVRQGLSFGLFFLGCVAYVSVPYVGNALCYYAGAWIPEYGNALFSCPQWLACPFALMTVLGDWPIIVWDATALDFQFYSHATDFSGPKPYVAYALIQLTMILLLAHFARDAVIRWRRGEQ